MPSTMITMAFVLLLPADAPAKSETPRQPSPFAPSLPQLTSEEEEKLDQIIDRFIQYDTGKLTGAEGKKALEEFQKLGPEATFALIRGMNRAAEIEHSCPAVVIAKKVNSILRATNDPELLEFARENIGAGITHSRHMGILKDLRALCIVRKSQVARNTTTVARNTPANPASLKTMTVADLASLAEKEQVAEKLKPILTELGNRNGDQVLAALARAAESADTEIRTLAQATLDGNLSKLGATHLKQRLKDTQAQVRESAARVVGTKGLRLGGELIELLGDDSDEVRQTARQALVKLSKGTDHGPDDAADKAARDEAIRLWKAWWVKQGGK